MYHYHQINKYPLDNKAFGIYHYKNPSNHRLLHGVDDNIPMPVSRINTTLANDIYYHNELKILLDSPDTGPGLIVNEKRNHVRIM
jgi:homoserine O-succinyltransferase/O-acetyltransferase